MAAQRITPGTKRILTVAALAALLTGFMTPKLPIWGSLIVALIVGGLAGLIVRTMYGTGDEATGQDD
ncbi:MAG TPA: hypothetical protein ENK80_02085 [Rhodobacterales bacterium]|nr:hypothetical protein [Rhodobacterales bacterium]